jgi:hypothetical protein
MSLSGPLAPNGKQALLGMKIWEEETNPKAGYSVARFSSSTMTINQIQPMYREFTQNFSTSTKSISS